MIPDGDPSPPAGKKSPRENHLAGEKSPYLMQHAGNPVDWYPWGEEAFAKAEKEDKPVFLSIGYATCHWCHVMAHESFEDDEVAAQLNRDFVCIKVDREERPDIDGVYMAVSQMMTGSGGWPLSIFMSADKKPFFAGTYIPKTGRYGSAGLLDLLPRIARLWHEQRDRLLENAETIIAALGESRRSSTSGPESSILTEGYEALALRFDAGYGGFGAAPKFPTPHNLLFLIRYAKSAGSKRALVMAEKTLRAIRVGGIYDHIGGGIHRYSTDARWRVPHFEKMLYDQALILMACTEAYDATRNPEYREMADDIAAYVLRDLSSPDGSFRSAEDADSEGREGAFYLWTTAELEAVLGPEDARLAERIYNVTREGNFQEHESDTGKNILFRSQSIPELSAILKLSEAGLISRMDRIRTALYHARIRRPRPLCDDKVLTDWNSLFIAALAHAARVFGNATFRDVAENAMAVLLGRMRTQDGGLLHRFRDGEAAIPAFGDDYAFTIRALLELYGTTFSAGYLATAIELNAYFIAHFWDEVQGGFYSVADNGETLLIRKKEIYDGAHPSCNSVACENLLLLAQLTGDVSYRDKADDLIRVFSGEVKESPAAYCWFLCALGRAIWPSREVVITGNPSDPGTRRMLDALTDRYIPNLSVLLREPGPGGEEIARIAPFTRDMEMVDGLPTARVCSGGLCLVPVTDAGKMMELLGESGFGPV